MKEMKDKSYSFVADISSLHYNVDLLVTDYTPLATKRACDRMRVILDRIQENRERGYIPIEIKNYFKEDD